MEMKPYGFATTNILSIPCCAVRWVLTATSTPIPALPQHGWGVEMLDVPERIGFAVANAGVDIISGLFDNEAGMEAYNRGKNGYYETHPLPEALPKRN